MAGGLHRESETHAVQIALMALKMMELSDEVMSPHGEPIKVRKKSQTIDYQCLKYCSLFLLFSEISYMHFLLIRMNCV